MLSDLAFPENGVREYVTDRQTWTVIIRGRVGIALSAALAKDWRNAGARVWALGHPEDRRNRVMAIECQRAGWRREWYLVAAYAPTAKDGASAERERFWHTLQRVVTMVGGDHRIVIGGGHERSG